MNNLKKFTRRVLWHIPCVQREEVGAAEMAVSPFVEMGRP